MSVDADCYAVCHMRRCRWGYYVIATDCVLLCVIIVAVWLRCNDLPYLSAFAAASMHTMQKVG